MNIKAPRAWYKPTGVMVESKHVEHINFELDTIGLYLPVDGKLKFSNMRLKYFELMWPAQYDEENELYDGDIVVSDNYPIREEDGYVGVIEHDDGVFWLTRRLKNGSEARGMSDGIADYLYEHRNDNLKRIGNIYENSDLLLAPKEGADKHE